MKKLFNDEQINFIINNYETMSCKDIANYLGNYKAQQISGWLSNNGFKKKSRSIFTKSDKEFMKNNYKSMPYKEIATILNFTERQVRGWINNNCERKIRTFNDNYFECIDNPNKAYWLGFIYADGWICNNKSTSNYELGIELKSSDRYHLENFNNELGGVHKIVDKHYEKYICDSKKISITDSSVIRIYSKKMVNDLINQNVVENKTLKPIFPKIEKYFYDFLRGYIDGDGCIYVPNDKKNIVVHITSATPDIFYYLQQKLQNESNINSYVYKCKDRKYRIYFYRKNAEELLDLIYYDKNVQKLDRKYQKYLIIKGSPIEKSIGNNTGKIGKN